MKEPIILSVDPDQPDVSPIRIAAETIRKGGVVVFPTQCLYGLGADAFNADAVDQIFQLKRRPPENPILVLIPERDYVDRIAGPIPPAAEKIMDVFWPGSVTLLFEARSSLPAVLTADTGKIGVRLPLHPVARRLVAQTGRPMTGTSANLSGEPGAMRISDISNDILSAADLVIDAGTLRGGKGSTVVDVTVFPPRIVREGIVPADSILSAILY